MPTHTTRDTASTTTSSAIPSCTTAKPGKYGEVPIDACNANYSFDPSFEGNMAFAALFGITTVIHLIEAIAFKKRFAWTIIMAAVWETIAFVLRTLGAHHQQVVTYDTLGTILFLLAPLWINAFVYMSTARMIYHKLPEKKIWGIKAIRITVISVWLDVIFFLVQLTGGVLLSSTDSKMLRLGQHIYMAGVGVQLAFILMFIGLTSSFYMKLKKLEGRGMGKMQWLIWTMLAVLTLIVVRIIYRLAEFGPGVGENNPLLRSENYAFLLDAFPMLLALILINAIHPGMILRGPDSEFPKVTRREKKELKRQKKAEKRQAKEVRKAQKNGTYQLQPNSSDERLSDTEARNLV